MISIVSTGICDILQNFISIHAIPLCNLQHPLRSERLLSINVQGFSLASLPNWAVIGKLHTTSDKSPSLPRPKLNRSSVIHSDSMSPSRILSSSFGTRSNSDQLRSLLVHLQHASKTHGHQLGRSLGDFVHLSVSLRPLVAIKSFLAAGAGSNESCIFDLLHVHRRRYPASLQLRRQTKEDPYGTPPPASSVPLSLPSLAGLDL
jgi:hypothetical protein